MLDHPEGPAGGRPSGRTPAAWADPCADQDEVDHYWEKLTDGGQEVQCGWLKDRYGLSWQVVPTGWEAMMTDPERVARSTTAMLGIVKLDIAALRAAADGP